MSNQQLADYISQCMAQGQTKEQIKQSLLSAGWREEDIDGVLGGEITNISAPIDFQQSVFTTPSQIKYAGFWVRYIAISIDTLIFTGACILVNSSFYILSILIGISGGIFATIIIVFLFGAYFIIMTYKWQTTLGKKLANLTVVSDGAGILTLGQVILRETIGRMISSILYVGYIMVGFTERKQGLHDKIAKTLVIYKDPNKKVNPLIIVLGIVAPMLSIIAIAVTVTLLMGISIFSLSGKAFNFNINNNSSSTSQANIPAIVNSSPVSQSGEATSNNISAYDTLIKSLMADGWKKGSFMPVASDPSGAVPFTFYYPSDFVGYIGTSGEKGHGIDIISGPMSSSFDPLSGATSSTLSFSKMVKVDIGLLGGVSFEEYMARAEATFLKQSITSDFMTASGLSGKKITLTKNIAGGFYSANSILLHTGKRSDSGQEVLITFEASYNRGGQSTTDSVSDEIIDKIAKSIRLQ